MTVDGVNGSSLSLLAPNPTVSYVDTDLDPTDSTTTQQVFRLLTPLIGSGGLLRTYPQMCKIAAVNTANTPSFYYRFRVQQIVLNLNLVGSNANIVAAGDLYNRVRVNAWETDLPYSSTVYPVFDIDNQIDWTRAKKHTLDHVGTLSATAFDSANEYPAAQTQNVKVSIKVNRTFEAYSASSGGAPTGFDTREGNLLLALVSDSAVAPHPSFSGSVRIYYTQLTL